MECKHYWVCGQPVSGFVESTCRHCGEVRRWETLVSIEHKKSKDLPDTLSKDTSHMDDSQLVAIS
ncbi:MAG: hypothetical protein HN929_12155 [Chloroflexi bacterium]|nr:hypothetical protein [Chloroflexota bacterium]MBT7082193.1 hypothetical protein [Chloroflexota bacterium]MBT7289912.1 hypothetical protein [Chloroflexota bacterium]